MQKKTIFIFSTAYFPYVGGAEVAIKEITDRVLEYDFILFTAKIKRSLPKIEKIGNIQVYRLGFGYSFDKFLLPILAVFKYFRIVSDLEFRISNLILWGIMASYGSIAAYFIKLVKPNISFLLTLQEGDSEFHLKHGKFGLVGFFGKRIIKKADSIQAISSYLNDFAVFQGVYSPITVVPNGVDIQKIKNLKIKTQNEKENFKNKLNIKDNEKIVITTSRLVYKNGIDVLIKAIYELKNLVPLVKIKLLILGDGELKNELENLVLKLDLKNEVLFLGFVFQDKIYEYLAISDVFCRPSRSEGLGNSFLEAMACGVPVVGTNVGGIPDFLIYGETGLFCKVDNECDLAEKIKILLEDNILRAKIIENAKKLVYENYDWNSITGKMQKLFANLFVSQRL